MKKKIQIRVCKSCGRDNAKSCTAFRSLEGIEGFYRNHLGRGFFGTGSWADLQIVDCLTNCDTPNSVEVCGFERTFDFAWISTEGLALEVIQFARRLQRDAEAKPAGILQDHLLDHSTGRGKIKTKNHPLQPQLPKPVWLDNR